MFNFSGYKNLHRMVKNAAHAKCDAIKPVSCAGVGIDYILAAIKNADNNNFNDKTINGYFAPDGNWHKAKGMSFYDVKCPGPFNYTFMNCVHVYVCDFINDVRYSGTAFAKFKNTRARVLAYYMQEYSDKNVCTIFINWNYFKTLSDIDRNMELRSTLMHEMCHHINYIIGRAQPNFTWVSSIDYVASSICMFNDNLCDNPAYRTNDVWNGNMLKDFLYVLHPDERLAYLQTFDSMVTSFHLNGINNESDMINSLNDEYCGTLYKLYSQCFETYDKFNTYISIITTDSPLKQYYFFNITKKWFNISEKTGDELSVFFERNYFDTENVSFVHTRIRKEFPVAFSKFFNDVWLPFIYMLIYPQYMQIYNSMRYIIRKNTQK